MQTGIVKNVKLKSSNFILVETLHGRENEAKQRKHY